MQILRRPGSPLPVLVCLSGLPGVGKSTIARALAARTGALWLRVDAAEQAMRDSHMVWSDLADGGYAALRAVAEGALGQGYDVIFDAVNPIALTRGPWADLAARLGAGFVPVELVCEDTAEHRCRIESRRAEVPGLALPDWTAVMARAFEPWDGALRLDTAQLGADEAARRIETVMKETRHGADQA